MLLNFWFVTQELSMYDFLNIAFLFKKILIFEASVIGRIMFQTMFVMVSHTSQQVKTISSLSRDNVKEFHVVSFLNKIYILL